MVTIFTRYLTYSGHFQFSGRPAVTDEVVQMIKELFEGTLKQSLRFATRSLPVSYSTVQKVMRKQLKSWPYKMKLVQALHHNDRPKRIAFAELLLNHPNPDFINNIAFSDEATFHVSGVVNRHNVRIWGPAIPTPFVRRRGTHQKSMCGVA